MSVLIASHLIISQLATGTMFFTFLYLHREIRESFQRFNFIFAAILWVLDCLLLWGKDDFSTIMTLLAAGGCLILARGASAAETRLDKISHLMEAVNFGVGVLLGINLWIIKTLDVGQATGFFMVNQATGAFLLGTVHVGMILGHWYLIMRDLPFQHLIKASKLFLTAVAVRTVWTGVEFAIVDTATRERWLGPDLMFVVMRCTWGLLAPLVMAFLTLRLAKTKNNQAATGMLYVCEFCVLGGEAIAAYLRM